MFKAAETQARIVLGVVKGTANGPNVIAHVPAVMLNPQGALRRG